MLLLLVVPLFLNVFPSVHSGVLLKIIIVFDIDEKPSD
jgi:hypothetical protein